MIGRTVAHYQILEALGGGGMGEVYLAEDTRLRRRVALKVLPTAMADDPERLERFAREAEALASLNHPNIVTVHAVEETEGRHVLVMEYVEGHTLGEEIPPEGLSDERFFQLAIPLADAVSSAHEKGVTHRDLKPANVMVTRDDRVKVVDFGLAKLRLEAQAREQTMVVGEELTEAGRILGTYPYMAPEQIKGQPADHRADVFSLGVVLYEMATGERPFSGETSADLISSILRDEPPPAHQVNPQLPPHLHRILAHCLEKDPDRRFQTAKDLRNELFSLQQELRSEHLLRTTSIQHRVARLLRPRRRRLAVAGIALALAAAGAWALLGGVGTKGGPASTAAAGAAGPEVTEEARPSIAVLFFQNLTGDPELDWLRTGLTEMLVTDLSQSPGLRVLSTDRLYQVFQDLGRLDTAVISADLVRTVAEQTRVGTLLLGSYAQVGDTLQVNITLQDAASGEIVGAQRVQGAGESGVFTVVDRVSEGVLQTLERSGRLSAPAPSYREQGIESVTTSSVEAYRFYAEATNFNHQLKLAEAIPLYERAIELDPQFAMAHARLARIHETLGREEEFGEFLERAFALADRLPPRERYFVQGSYFSRTRSSYDKAIERLREAVAVYPDHHAARYQLGLLYSYLELHEEAATELEELVKRGYDFDGVHNALAQVYQASGRAAEARRLLESWEADDPRRWSRQLVVGWHAVNQGDVDRAFQALDRAEELRPGSPFTDYARWRASMVAGRFDEAAEVASRIRGMDEAYWRWRGAVAQAMVALYHGRVEQALARLEEAAGIYHEGEPLAGTGRNLAADLLLDLDRPREALEQADGAIATAEDDWPAMEGRLWAAVARERQGDGEEADRLARDLQALSLTIPGPVEDRLHHRLLGLLARARGDGKTAVAELERAEELLPPRGLPWHRHRLPDHLDVWFDLAEAYRALGRSGPAIERYRRIVESGTEHVYHPVEYVRSHYLLGRLLEERGDEDGAREAYRAFVSFWGDGEIDREQVADARARLRGLGG